MAKKKLNLTVQFDLKKGHWDLFGVPDDVMSTAVPIWKRLAKGELPSTQDEAWKWSTGLCEELEKRGFEIELRLRQLDGQWSPRNRTFPRASDPPSRG